MPGEWEENRLIQMGEPALVVLEPVEYGLTQEQANRFTGFEVNEYCHGYNVGAIHSRIRAFCVSSWCHDGPYGAGYRHAQTAKGIRGPARRKGEISDERG